MKPKVSIIVPIYNMEKYIQRCLDSIIEQTLKHIEIIAINDGSTDGTASILEAYKKKDSRITVVHQQNEGVASARNEGIRLANGKYIGFVDPDDWVSRDMYETLFEEAEQESADIVMCTYIREYGTHSLKKNFNQPLKVCYRNEDVQMQVMRRLVGPIDDELASPELLDAWGTVWSKLYRANILKSNDIFFTDLKLIGTNEDSLFNIEATYYAKAFVFINKPYYHYWKANEQSITSGYKPQLHNQWVHLYQLIEQFLQGKNVDETFKTALANRISLNVLGLGLNELSHSNTKSALQKMKTLRQLLNEHHINHPLAQLKIKHLPFVWKVFFLCAKYKQAVALYILLKSINVLRKMK